MWFSVPGRGGGRPFLAGCVYAGAGHWGQDTPPCRAFFFFFWGAFETSRPCSIRRGPPICGISWDSPEKAFPRVSGSRAVKGLSQTQTHHRDERWHVGDGCSETHHEQVNYEENSRAVKARQHLTQIKRSISDKKTSLHRSIAIFHPSSSLAHPIFRAPLLLSASNGTLAKG